MKDKNLKDLSKLDFKSHMMILRRICLIGFRNLFRNAWLTIAAVAVMTVTLCIILFGFISYQSLNDTIADLGENFTVSIFIKDKVGPKKLSALEQDLSSHESVTSISIKSKEEALKDFQQRYKDKPKLLEGVSLTGNVLPASYEVTLADPAKYQEIVDIAEKEDHEDVVLGSGDNQLKQESFQGFAETKSFVTRGSIFAAIIFGTISVLIIFNTIRMAIYTRSKEIEIMKLIGATPGYIRGPFLVEASLYGTIAAFIALGAAYAGLIGLSSKLRSDIVIEPTQELFTDYWYTVFLITLAMGILLGYISSIIAMARYLRLKKW